MQLRRTPTIKSDEEDWEEGKKTRNINIVVCIFDFKDLTTTKIDV
jgi:hypothetical protein